MARYFILSILLHAVVFIVLTLRTQIIIEDPIVSVSLIDRPNRTAGSSPRKQTPTNKPQKVSTTREEISSDHSNESPESNLDGHAYESGTVSVKPRVLQQFKAEYPEEAKNARIEGPVKLSVLIDPRGRVEEVTVLEGPGYGLNETAQQALKKFLFTPAEKEGQKVAVRIVYIYRFRLESR